MKKIALIAICLLLAAAMSLPALAQSSDTVTEESTYRIPVNGTSEPGQQRTDVISVDITWDAMAFSFTEQSAGTWDPVNHKYVGVVTADQAGWSKDRKQIKVVSNSNIPVVSALQFEKAQGVPSGTKCEFFENSDSTTALASDRLTVTMPSSEGLTGADVPSMAVYFGVSGDQLSESGTLGNIAIKIKSAIQNVNSYAEFCTAVGNGGYIRLMCNINAQKADFVSVGDDTTVSFDISKNTYINLNGYNITRLGSSSDNEALKFTVKNDATLEFKNGELKSLGFDSDGSYTAVATGGAEGGDDLSPKPIQIVCVSGDLVLENCKVYSYGQDNTVEISGEHRNVFMNNSSIKALKDETTAGKALNAKKGTVIMQGDCNIGEGTASEYAFDNDALAILLPGKYNFNIATMQSAHSTYFTDNDFYEFDSANRVAVKGNKSVVTVATKQQLLDAIGTGNTSAIIRLTADIALDAPIKHSCNIDLAGHTLSAPDHVFETGSDNSVFNLQNGTVEGKDKVIKLTNTKSHVLNDLYVYCNKGTDGLVSVHMTSGTANVSGRCELRRSKPFANASGDAPTSGVTVVEGKYNFNPGGYLPTGYTLNFLNNSSYTFTAIVTE